MDAKQPRLDRLKEILARDFEGNMSALSRRLGYEKPTFIIELLSGRKNFGEKLARKIESKLPLPDGYLDGKPQPGGGASHYHNFALTPASAEHGAEFQKLIDSDPALAMKFNELLLMMVASKRRDGRKKAKRPAELVVRSNA